MDTTETLPGKPAAVRLIALGDELIAGAGDTRMLGWLGRSAVRAAEGQVPVDLWPVALPGDTTYSLSQRWDRDVTQRIDVEGQQTGRTDHRVVLGLGRGDAVSGITVPRSRLNLATVLDGLERMRMPSFVVGPPPAADPELTARLREHSLAYADVCARRHLPYVEVIEHLADHDQWQSEMRSGDRDLPGQVGYGLMTWLVLNAGFERWLRSPQP